MARDSAERQKQMAKEMLGISDDRAQEIFKEQPDRKQQKKKELEEKNRTYECDECDEEFDTEQGMKVHKGQVH
ncbi:MAG: hypothetical protein ABEJ56_07085 [Candidatus Nanohaloarchaea archaeon]